MKATDNCTYGGDETVGVGGQNVLLLLESASSCSAVMASVCQVGEGEAGVAVNELLSESISLPDPCPLLFMPYRGREPHGCFVTDVIIIWLCGN